MASTLYHLSWYCTQDSVPCVIIPSSSVCPEMPRLIVMSTAVGSLELLPSAWTVMPLPSSAWAVGSVILLVSPWTPTLTSATKEALVTCAILASLSFTTWSAETPAATAAGDAELPDDELPPHPAAAISATTRRTTIHGATDLTRMTGSLLWRHDPGAPAGAPL